MKISTKELRDLIRESIGEVIKESEVSGLGGTPDSRGGRSGGGLMKGGSGPVHGEDSRWKRQLTDVAKKAIAGDSKAFANAIAMAKDSGPGTYGKEVHDYLQAWNSGKTDAPAPQGLGEAVMEAKVRKMVGQIVKESLQANKPRTKVRR